MRVEKLYYRIDGFLALVQGRIKNAECVGQPFIGSEIQQFTDCAIPTQRLIKVDGVLTQVISVACDQNAGRQICCNLWMLRICKRQKRRLFIVSAIESFWQEKANLIESASIEHTAD